MSHGESWNWWVTQLQADKELSGREAGQSDEWEVGVGVGRGGGELRRPPHTGSLEGTTVSL